jgi:L-arabinose transport system ATP-binding protein
MNQSFVQFEGIGKEFPGVTALDRITFGIKEGSVHGLVGENGAGKSTLLKVLSGYHEATRGEIFLAGKKQSFRNPVDAIEAGVAVIYQELNLVPEMSVAENVLLGQMPNRYGFVDKRRSYEQASSELALLEEDIDPAAKLSSLSIAQRQMVEIAKALIRRAKVIAFDEPTSSLTEKETGKLFSIIRDLRTQGKVIIYVSHRLQEVFRICDAVTVLRDGRRIRTIDDIATVDHDGLVKLMVGRSIEDVYDYAEREHGSAALEVEGIYGEGLSKPVSLSVAKGEIVGIFGLVGAGRTELLKLIYGAVRKAGGKVRISGSDVRIGGPRDAIGSGIAFCPEDRKDEGIIPTASVRENINISARRGFAKLGFLIDDTRELANAEKQVRQLDIKIPSLDQLIVNLSGGNQQKVILGRWFGSEMKVILFDEPTRGVDVGARSEVYSIIQELAGSGIGILVASSDMSEVLGICDRIIVMRQGETVCKFDREEATEEKLLKAALPCSREG